MYQTDIVKKANKWQCKLCGEKQSLLQEFCRGTGKFCREYAQKMNSKCTSMDEAHLEVATILENLNQDHETGPTQSNNITSSNSPPTKNKWAKYVEDDDERGNEEEDFNSCREEFLS
ncbi:unnamed protein product [Hermetia illucens]|uniref:MRN complex-interacting protein N-terminal domain-containing protein n=2 Tax=Hermetia illucens TaxID=343691 RepID=A0A7R8YQ32_HERIL|nr:unnamed protein product [Hermetia illucens]